MAMHKKSSSEANKAVSLRPDVDEDLNVLNDDQVKEDAQKMDALMQQLLGGIEEEEEQPNEENDQGAEQVEEEFAFRLFANQPIAKVNIVEEEEEDRAQLVADLQQVEFDETDPEFQAKVSQVVVDYDMIIQQSKLPYPTLQLPQRVIHLNGKEETSTKKKIKRKSKKCRDFEKKVKAGEIQLKPKMRNPATPGGWPGWPGNLTKVAIVNYVSPRNKSRSYQGSYKTISKGSARGGSRGGGRGGGRGGKKFGFRPH